MQIKVGEHMMGNENKPYIIAEIGANHNGDIFLAKKAIDAAKDCGCNAVKFQSWTPDSLIAKEEYERNQEYSDSPKKHFGSLKEMVETYYLRSEQHAELKGYCDNIGIDFCSTPFSKDEVDLLEDTGVPFFKIASMDINNLDLVRYIAQKNKPIILSTGMAELSEIERAVICVENTGNNKLILLHCVSIYPPEDEEINLNNILMLKQTFGYPVGFSDHTIGTSIPIAAVCLGACLIEKHFTVDKNLPGWDHEISADPAEMKTIVKEACKVTKALGTHKRVVSLAEREKRKKFRRSIVTIKDLKENSVISYEDLTYKRPGTGIRPDEVDYVVGRTIKRQINKDELINWTDLE